MSKLVHTNTIQKQRHTLTHFKLKKLFVFSLHSPFIYVRKLSTPPDTLYYCTWKTTNSHKHVILLYLPSLPTLTNRFVLKLKQMIFWRERYYVLFLIKKTVHWKLTKVSLNVFRNSFVSRKNTVSDVMAMVDTEAICSTQSWSKHCASVYYWLVACLLYEYRVKRTSSTVIIYFCIFNLLNEYWFLRNVYAWFSVDIDVAQSW